jgi:hypothetical protein
MSDRYYWRTTGGATTNVEYSITQWNAAGDHPDVSAPTQAQRKQDFETYGRSRGCVGWLSDSIDGPIMVLAGQYIVTDPRDGRHRVINRTELNQQFAKEKSIGSS